MNDLVRSILSILQPELPVITGLIPIPAVFSNMLAAVGQRLLGKALATPEEVVAAVKADPVKAVEALKPLEDHLSGVASTAAESASTIPKEALASTTETVKEAVIFATNDADVTVSPVDRDGGRYLSKWYSRAQWSQLVDAACVKQAGTGSKA